MRHAACAGRQLASDAPAGSPVRIESASAAPDSEPYAFCGSFIGGCQYVAPAAAQGGAKRLLRLPKGNSVVETDRSRSKPAALEGLIGPSTLSPEQLYGQSLGCMPTRQRQLDA